MLEMCQRNRLNLYTLVYNRAAGERISGVTRLALTVRIMLNNSTLRVYATCTDTWVCTALVNTCQVGWTIGTSHALGSAVGWPAEIIEQAGACRRTAYIDAF